MSFGRFFVVFLSILVIFIISCSSFPSYSVYPSLSYTHRYMYIDDNFTDEETNVILDSFKEWNCSSGGIVNFEFANKLSIKDVDKLDYNNSIFIFKTTSHNKFIQFVDIQMSKKGLTTVGYYREFYDRAPYIYIAVDRIPSKERFKPLLMHEEGHSLGLKHYDGNQCVMNSVIDDAALDLNNYDFQNLCELYKCDPLKMSTCSK